MCSCSQWTDLYPPNMLLEAWNTYTKRHMQQPLAMWSCEWQLLLCHDGLLLIRRTLQTLRIQGFRSVQMEISHRLARRRGCRIIHMLSTTWTGSKGWIWEVSCLNESWLCMSIASGWTRISWQRRSPVGLRVILTLRKQHLDQEEGRNKRQKLSWGLRTTRRTSLQRS